MDILIKHDPKLEAMCNECEQPLLCCKCDEETEVCEWCEGTGYVGIWYCRECGGNK